MPIHIDISDLSAENVSCASVDQIDSAFRIALGTGNLTELHRCIKFMTEYIICISHKPKLETVSGRKKDSGNAIDLLARTLSTWTISDIAETAMSNVLDTRVGGDNTVHRECVRLFETFINTADCFSHQLWKHMVAAMDRQHYFLLDGSLALLSLLSRKKTVCQDLMTIWVEWLLHHRCSNRALSLTLLGQITDCLGVFMNKLILSSKSNEKDVSLFASVLRRCLHAVAEAEISVVDVNVGNTDTNEGNDQLANSARSVCVSPMSVFVAPLWKDIWRVIASSKNSSQSIKLLGLDLFHTGVKIFPRTIDVAVGEETHEEECTTYGNTTHAAVSVFLNIAIGSKMPVAVREKAIVLGLTLLREEKWCTLVNAERIFCVMGCLLGSESLPKGSQYNLLREIEVFLKANPFNCYFPPHTTICEAIKSCQNDMVGIHLKNAAVAFLVAFKDFCFPGIMKILKAQDTSKRTLKLIDGIFSSGSIGVVPALLLLNKDDTTDDGVSDDAKTLIRKIFFDRCLHLESVLEICMDALATQTPLSRRGVRMSPILFNMVNNFSKGIASNISEHLSKAIHTSENIWFDNSSELYPWLMGSILFASTNAAIFKNSCGAFIHALSDIKKYCICNGNESISCYVALWIQLIKQVLDADSNKTHNLFSTGELQILEGHVFPDLLKVPAVMEVATSLALSLSDGMQLLFQCIGHYQDEALDVDALPADVVYYIELIDCVVTQNAAQIRRRYQKLCDEQVSKVHDSICSSTSFNVPVKSQAKKEEESSNVLFGIDILDYNEDEEKYSEVQPRHAAISDVKKQSYMKEVEIEQEVSAMTRAELEDSVLGEDSFLGCFIPFIVALAESKNMMVAIKVVALRALSSYMLCSPRIMISNLPLLSSLLVEYDGYDGSESYTIALQALHIFLLTYRPSVSDPSLLVDITIAQVDVKIVDPKNNCVEFLCHIVDVVVSLIKNGAVRNPEEFGALIVLVLANFNKYQGPQSSRRDIRSIKTKLLHLCNWRQMFISRLCFFIINLTDKDASNNILGINNRVKGKLMSYFSSKGPNLRLSMIAVLIDTIVLFGSNTTVAQIEEVGEKILSELLLTGDEQLLLYLSLFPYTEEWRVMISNVGITDSKPLSSSKKALYFNIAPDLLKKLECLIGEKKKQLISISSASNMSGSTENQAQHSHNDPVKFHNNKTPKKTLPATDQRSNKSKQQQKINEYSSDPEDNFRPKTRTLRRVSKRSRVILSSDSNDSG